MKWHFTGRSHFKNSGFFFLVFLVSGCMLQSNAQITYKEYLLSSTRTGTQHLFDSLLVIYHQDPLHKPIFNRIELRTKTNEFRLDQQQYTLRISTSDFLYNHFQTKINRLEQYSTELEKKEQLSNMLYIKYKSIGKYEVLRVKLQQLKEQKSLLENLVQFHKDPLVRQTKDNLEKYYEANIKLNKAQLEFADTEYELSQLKSELLNANSGFESKLKIPDIATIKGYITEFKEPREYIEDERLKTEISKSEIEMKQKSSGNNRLLQYFQFEYQSDPKDLLNKKLSLGIGLRIPYLISQKYLTEDHRIKSLKLKIEEEELKEKKMLRLASIKNKITLLFNSFEFLQKQIQHVNTVYNTDSLLTLGYTNAELLIEIKLQENKMHQQMHELHMEAINLFIDFLYLTGHFYREPELYYLSFPFQKLTND